MIRKLALLISILVAWSLLRTLFRSASASAPAAGPSGARFEGALVRDRICQTFLPRSNALVLKADGSEHFFCSEACRAKFLESRRALS